MNSPLCLHPLCIVSRLPVFADRWADEFYCAASPTPQKQALWGQPEELHRGRRTTADTRGPQSTTHGREGLDLPSFLVDSLSHRFVTLLDSWFIPETIKDGVVFNRKEQYASRPSHHTEGRAFLYTSLWERVGKIRGEFCITFEEFTSSEWVTVILEWPLMGFLPPFNIIECVLYVCQLPKHWGWSSVGVCQINSRWMREDKPAFPLCPSVDELRPVRS